MMNIKSSSWNIKVMADSLKILADKAQTQHEGMQSLILTVKDLSNALQRMNNRGL